MTTLRLPILPIAELVFVIAAFTPLLTLLAPNRAGLLVVCSNTTSVRDTLIEHCEQYARTSVDVVRVPTSEALSHLATTHRDSEFDVWLGGPAEAHAETERLGLLHPAEGINVSGLPEHYRSAS